MIMALTVFLESGYFTQIRRATGLYSAAPAVY
jgi:hypothetical protein